MPAAKDVGGEDVAVRMRGGAHLHMSKMGLGERTTSSLDPHYFAAGPHGTRKRADPAFFLAFYIGLALDLRDFSISPSLGNPPKLISEPLSKKQENSARSAL